MFLEFFYNAFEENILKLSIVYNDLNITYEELLSLIKHCRKEIKFNNIKKGEVIALIGDYTPNAIAILFALIENRNIIVPFDYSQQGKINNKIKIAGVNKSISISSNDDIEYTKISNDDYSNDMYCNLRSNNIPGLVLFTSGTSGEPKAAVHDFNRLLEKYRIKRKTYRTLNFLLFDHWGGLNTMFHTLSNGGTVIALNDRRPGIICSFIEKHKIELLPASPTFLNLLILSEQYKHYDLSSMKIISYGTEPMPESTLKKIRSIFPNVKLQQTYGLIELGVLRSKSKGDDSLWVKIGGEGFQTRVVNGLLEIKAESAMLGYLNAQSPFTDDGWFMTGDQVETDGEYYKILGRKSELINVGGEKVYPAEVESVIQEIENIAEVTVFGEKHPIIGNIVCARIRLKANENEKELKAKIKHYCQSKLKRYMVPVKVIIDDGLQFNERYKKMRANYKA